MIAPAVTAVFLLSHLVFANTNASIPTVKVTVDTQKTYQTIDGCGISHAFQRARQIQRLSTTHQQKVLDLLFSATTGAGFTILRNGIGCSSNYSRDWMRSITPKARSSPNTTLHQ
ncbi:glycoside hydrolase family 30 protein [Trematosphaeria pertusa]|uniref:Glycoside hydrolase family 30 protein n=1 Tax=Trematosphaeria pertusa TaxID=390896 RepID=A0A6A6IMF9_9PLEO|nr:glycoside hydrolase family 30 protein [Trematosphaeria pertusa]KAF2250740.1 glycoside hydrolase family 30 protein [Trematosphaeria pertusa]